MSILQELSQKVMRRFSTLNKEMEEIEWDIVPVLPKDAIMSINKPIMISAQAAHMQMNQTEAVLGVELDGDARAYPVSILSVHEVVNDTAGGIPVAVTWSPLCYTGNVFSRTILDRCLTFGVSGKLLHNGLVMYDHQTGSLWSQVLGKAVSGALKTMNLKRISCVHTTWDAWLREYPHTTVLSKERSPYGYYEEDHMMDYYLSERTGLRLGSAGAGPLPGKEIVLGLIFEGVAVAYPHELLRKARMVHDIPGLQPLIIFFDKETNTGRAYHSCLDGTAMTFFFHEGRFIDYQTTSIWSALSGRCMQGPLKGKRLEPLPSTNAFWFAWNDFFPDTRVYLLPEVH